MAIQAKIIPIQWTPDMPVFASGKFLQAVGDECGWIGGFDEAGALRCILPYTIVRKAVIRMVRFRVETIPVGGEFEIEEEKRFLDSAMSVLRQLGAHLVIPATTNTIFRTYPSGAIAAPYGSHVVDLRRSEDELFAAISSSHRRQIRAGQKAGLVVREAPELADLAHEIVRETFAKSSMPFMSLPAFRRYVAGLESHVKVMVVERDRSVQGCIVAPFSNHGAYYVYGGSIPDASPGAMHLLHWEAMRCFRALNVGRYDFVGARINPEKGSKHEGLSAFKERFGSHLKQGFMWKCAINRGAFQLYQLAVRYLRGSDIVDQERARNR